MMAIDWIDWNHGAICDFEEAMALRSRWSSAMAEESQQIHDALVLTIASPLLLLVIVPLHAR